MKYLLLSVLLILSGLVQAQTDTADANSGTETKLYTSDFATTFADPEDLVNFKKLRNYLTKKENKKNQLEASIKDFNEEDLIEINTKIEYCKTEAAFIGDGYTSSFTLTVKTANGVKTFSAREDAINADFINNVIIPELEKVKAHIEDLPNQNQIIEDQISLVNADIQSCQEQIDVALGPERDDQKFRAEISFYFTIMIGVLLLGFFIIIGFRSDKTIGRQLLSEVGLQFVTMFVLIIAVILFGILGVLEAKELTAILSGVSGYILGKGAKPIMSKAAEDAENAPPSKPTPDPVIENPPAPIPTPAPVPVPEVVAPEAPVYTPEPVEDIPSNPPITDDDLDNEGAVG